jgi:hypothetical protein
VLYRGGKREHQSVNRRSQKTSVLEESPRSEKPVFRTVAVVGYVRSPIVYLVVGWCVSQSVTVTCVVVIAIANKSGIQSEPLSSYQSHYPSVARENIYTFHIPLPFKCSQLKDQFPADVKAISQLCSILGVTGV